MRARPFATKLVAVAEHNQAGLIAPFERRKPDFEIAVARELLVDRRKKLERLRRNAKAAPRLELEIEEPRYVIRAGAAIDFDIVLRAARLIPLRTVRLKPALISLNGRFRSSVQCAKQSTFFHGSGPAAPRISIEAA